MTLRLSVAEEELVYVLVALEEILNEPELLEETVDEGDDAYANSEEFGEMIFTRGIPDSVDGVYGTYCT